MKTLEEFIQRLQDDATFEKQAQTFATGDALMAFVKREGYDFTLEQLTQKFKHQAKSAIQGGGLAPAPRGVNASTPEKPNDAACPRKPQAFPNSEKSTALLQKGERRL